ncbi:hypothetical protein N356_gp093 [Cellulophaga phage phi14:2]|uniref:Uncharacterized protein n=1 Tax=Cellulophaga phage phi14:2 TaxID=1327990 RepID=S0A2F3_9CAUD|nr:hypothetical protein N356_gp093 [Cellulophaga phage phi14:2]AGO48985.1 hypothetical protein Phi14:2_gp107 [Cellulophaga phage phi14:2]
MNLENNVKDVKKVIANCTLKPKRHSVMITLNQYAPEDSLLEISGENESMLDEYQSIIAVGNGTEFKPGDKILLDISALTKRIPDPNDRMAYIDMIDIKPVQQGDHTFTIISDSYILATVINESNIDLNA